MCYDGHDILLRLRMIVLYLGPDSLLPLGSILAAVAGLVLLFWHRLVGAARRVAGRKPPEPGEEDASLDTSPDDEGP
jgi:hypothetical protein